MNSGAIERARRGVKAKAAAYLAKTRAWLPDDCETACAIDAGKALEEIISGAFADAAAFPDSRAEFAEIMARLMVFAKAEYAGLPAEVAVRRNAKGQTAVLHIRTTPEWLALVEGFCNEEAARLGYRPTRTAAIMQLVPEAIAARRRAR